MKDWMYILASLLIAFIVSYRTIPTIINVSRSLKLFCEPNERSSTIHRVPTLGGISIFVGFILGLTLTRNGYILPGLTFIIAAVLIMFFVGLKDDILTLSPGKKLTAQFIVANILILLGHFRFTNVHGFLGFENINIWISYPLTLFVMIVFINAFNLIDGIDGLASGLSIFICSVFGGWFFLSGHYEYSIVAFSMVGALLGFFFYNVYGVRNKIFMGDTGSLILGTVMAILVIQFNEFNIDVTKPFAIQSSPAVSFGILIYPLFDTIRVFILRIVQKKSPFTADKNHVHHRLLLLGMSHKKATYTILSVNALFTLAVFQLQWMGLIGLMFFNILVCSLIFVIPSYFIQKRKLIAENDPHQQIVFSGRRFFFWIGL